MAFMFYFVAALLVLTLLAAIFVRASPAKLAGTLALIGPLALALIGAGLLLFGRAGLGGMALSGAVAWYASARMRRRAQPSHGRRSTVRTAALDMELDHDTGALEGVVLAGPHEGRTLGELGLDELIELHRSLEGDGESRQLLETYLDSRFPVWRENAQANGNRRQGAAPGAGPMSEQEAYQILGLEPGASAAEIRKAHRRLMQRVHPDLGGSSFLAARINEAKDVLLARHD